MAESSKLQNVIESRFDPESSRAKANRAALQEVLATIRSQEESIRLGGGAKAAAAQHAKKRLTVRERLKLLLDQETEFLELGLWAAHGMYTEYGGAPGAGVVTGLGRVCGRLCMIIANDATVKAGAFFPMTAKKVCVPRTSRWRIAFRRSTWWIRPACFCRCRRMYFRIRTTLGASSATTR